MEKAIECFTFVITRVPSNVYAAHGLGAVLAEQGHLNWAQSIFAQVNFSLMPAHFPHFFSLADEGYLLITPALCLNHGW